MSDIDALAGALAHGVHSAVAKPATYRSRHTLNRQTMIIISKRPYAHVVKCCQMQSGTARAYTHRCHRIIFIHSDSMIV